MSEREQVEAAKKKVLAVYPNARCWAGWGEDPYVSIWSGLRLQSERLSMIDTKDSDQAWLDAASRLPAPVEPSTKPIDWDMEAHMDAQGGMGRFDPPNPTHTAICNQCRHTWVVTDSVSSCPKCTTYRQPISVSPVKEALVEPAIPGVSAAEEPHTAQQWLERALGVYQITHCHSCVKEAIKILVSHPEAAPAEAIQDLECNSCGRVVPSGGVIRAGMTCSIWLGGNNNCTGLFTVRPESPQAEGAKSHDHKFFCPNDQQQCDTECRLSHSCSICSKTRADLESQPSSLAGTFEDNRIDLLKEVSKVIKRVWMDSSSESQSDLDLAQGMLMSVIHNSEGLNAARQQSQHLSVVELCLKYPNLSEYITQVEGELAQLKGQQSQPVIEPQLMNAINWLMGCGESDFMKPEGAPTYWWRSKFAERAGLEYDPELQQFRKAQKDLGR